MNLTAIRIFSPLLALLIWSMVSATEAEACSSEVPSGFSTPLVLPVDGQVAPPNTNVWVTAPVEDYFDVFPRVGPLEAADIVLRSDGIIIDTSARTVSATAGYVTHLWVVDPTTNFEEGQIVEVWVRDQLESTFTIEGSALTATPPAPVLEAIESSGEYFGYWSCGSESNIEVTVQDETSLLFVTEAYAVSGLPIDTFAVGTGRTATAYEMVPGDYALQVMAIDIAGNVSEPTELPVVRVPPSISGCSTSARSQPHATLFLLLMTFTGLRFERHARKRRSVNR